MADEVIRDEPARYPSRYGVHFSNIINRISWGSVWAGVMIALGMEVLLTLFGLAVGFGMYNWQAANPWRGITGWSVVWYLITVGWSMFFGAWCAARLSGNPIREAGILHGITTWGLAGVATMMIVTLGAWSVLREGVNVLSTAAIAGAQVAPAAARQATPSQLSQAAQQAGQTVNQLQQNAGPMAQNTADIISRLSWCGLGGALLGLITAILGGWLGRPRTVIFEEQYAPPGPSRLAA